MLLAVEDPLSEAVARRILASVSPRREVSLCLGLKGKDYLRQKAEKLNQTAKGSPVFLLTDLDNPKDCPPGLIKSWLKSTKQPNFLFRVAVMEVESWIMADRESFANFLSVPPERVPSNTDSIPKPKEYLVSLARQSKSSRLREDLVPAPGGTNKVGPAYNLQLASFVTKTWSPESAAKVSHSLRRALDRLRDFSSTG